MKPIQVDDLAVTDRPNSGQLVLADSLMTNACKRELVQGGVALFDLYQKHELTGYERIWAKGQAVSVEESAQFNLPLYMKLSDRPLYLRHCLSRLSDVIGSNATAERKFSFLKYVCLKYNEELDTHGISGRLVDDGLAIANAIGTLLKQEKKTPVVLRSLVIAEDDSSKNFLVAVFSVLISRQLEWTSERTTELVAQGGFFFNVGLLKQLPLKHKRPSQLLPNELDAFRTYPATGEETLRDYYQIPQSVRQIIFQHRECVNRTGFPNELNGLLIYPLAKVVGLAVGFTEFAQNRQEPCGRMLVDFLRTHSETSKFEPTMIRALAQSFINGVPHAKG